MCAAMSPGAAIGKGTAMLTLLVCMILVAIFWRQLLAVTLLVAAFVIPLAVFVGVTLSAGAAWGIVAAGFAVVIVFSVIGDITTALEKRGLI